MKEDRSPWLAPPVDAPDSDWPTLEEVTLRYMRRALVRAGGSKAGAAKILGVDRRTVNRMLIREAKLLGNGGGRVQ